MRTNKLKRSEKKRLKEEEREQRLREREIARLRRKKNRPLTFVSAFFILIFVSLIGYLVYFDAIKSEDFINSPYNTRQDTFSDRVVRGSIQSSDGELAVVLQAAAAAVWAAEHAPEPEQRRGFWMV